MILRFRYQVLILWLFLVILIGQTYKWSLSVLSNEVALSILPYFPDTAISLLTFSANRGLSAAHHNLGITYHDGEYCMRDDRKAFGMFLRAAQLGFVRAQVTVGDLYREGIGTAPDREKAKE